MCHTYYQSKVYRIGLSAILNDDDNKRFENISNSSSLNEIEISKISLNPNQPRTNFDQKSLDQLASSISELGLIQPITVQQSKEEFVFHPKLAKKTGIPRQFKHRVKKKTCEILWFFERDA